MVIRVMLEVKITAGKKPMIYQLPERWEEIPRESWPGLCMPILMGDSVRARVSLLLVLLRNKTAIHERLFMKLDPIHIKALCDNLGWIWAEKMISPPFESFDLEGITFLLPAKKLAYCSLIEYAYLDFYYNLYAAAAGEGKEGLAETYLDKLLAYMCRPADPGVNDQDALTFEGDYRERFNTILCDRRQPIIQKLDPAKKLAILLFFIGCKTAIHESYQGTIFLKPVDDTGLAVSGGRQMKPQEWIDMAFHLAGDKFGDLENTMFTNVFTIFHHLALQEKNKS